MPELPEVETVRRGLSDSVVGTRIQSARVRHARAVRRHEPGRRDFVDRVAGCQIVTIQRRGKFLWWELVSDDQPPLALIAHLGMSGQFRLTNKQRVVDRHARATFRLTDSRTVVFRDQRTFGWLRVDDWDGNGVPEAVSHIGLDPFDPAYDQEEVAIGMAQSQSGIKRLLLSQNLVSGVGNIYADEALWRAQVHPETPGSSLAQEGCSRVLDQVAAVMSAALDAGGIPPMAFGKHLGHSFLVPFQQALESYAEYIDTVV